MKILAIILIISSLTKLAVMLGDESPSETLSECFRLNQIPIDLEKLLAIVRGLIMADGLVGLFCGASILFLL